MLSADIKDQIQSAYSLLLERKGYVSRQCQRQMVADIANTLGNIEVDDEGARTSDGHISVIEAGTGTGKTVAYAIAALPIARALNKRLVIATATVALQEQIVLLDLPDIAHHADLTFSFALAKGRRRYLCLSRLDQALQAAGSANLSLALYTQDVLPPDESHTRLYEDMLTQLGRGDWDGDRDSWPMEVPHEAWSAVSTDHLQCTGRKCSHFDNCYFYKAREKIQRVDVVVTNHDLVLADLVMGGGAVLPAPEDAIYIFDEGHHLPDKAINHFSHFILLQSTLAWLEQLPGNAAQLAAELDENGELARRLGPLERGIEDLREQLSGLGEAVQPLLETAQQEQREARELRYRFPQGQLDPMLVALSDGLLQATLGVNRQTQWIQNELEERLLVADDADKDALELWLPVIAAANGRLAGAAGLWQTYREPDEADGPPTARWINFRDADEVQFNASPVSVNDALDELLWSRCFGAVLTSATLSIGGDFERFRRQAGIGADNHFRALPSPFDYAGRATLSVPMMTNDPRQADAHNAEVAQLLPGLLGDKGAGLVLFASWRQMYRITEQLPGPFRERLLLQGDHAKSEIIALHKQRIDAGEPSVIFGLASFSEGIDLPGAYCEHVVIVKIPFAVPDDPVGATLSEWIEARGGNSFSEIMVPDAALRLVQACGRLLRTEQDSGQVTILDRRLATQRYGQLLLNALPPFRRRIS